MTENEKLVRDETEAIECLKSNKPTSGYLMLQESIDVAIKALEEVQKYRAIGTVEEFRAVMENQTDEKPTAVHGIFGGTEYECKNCGSNVCYGDEYCRWCGQKIDWSDEE